MRPRQTSFLLAVGWTSLAVVGREWTYGLWTRDVLRWSHVEYAVAIVGILGVGNALWVAITRRSARWLWPACATWPAALLALAHYAERSDHAQLVVPAMLDETNNALWAPVLAVAAYFWVGGQLPGAHRRLVGFVPAVVLWWHGCALGADLVVLGAVLYLPLALLPVVAARSPHGSSWVGESWRLARQKPVAWLVVVLGSVFAGFAAFAVTVRDPTSLPHLYERAWVTAFGLDTLPIELRVTAWGTSAAIWGLSLASGSALVGRVMSTVQKS